MTDVPYAYKDQYDFYQLDENNRRLYFYKEPKHSLGLEAIYIDKSGKRYRSGITEYLLDETGVNSATESKTVKSVEYTDLSGRRIARPTNGVYVKTTTFSDGTKESKKVVR